MGWSWRIGRLSGIDVYVHFTFLILLGWVGLEHYRARDSWADALAGLGFILTLFGIVVLHELGHAVAARRFGIQTRDITLLPIGGVARLERMPDDPRQELVVALAGPAVNVVLASGLYIGLSLGQGMAKTDDVLRVGGNFLDQLFWVNVSLAAFNLLPAFPMDGGRVLRALLALRLDYVRATQIAASVGQAFALVLAFVGLLYNPFLIFIALFVWMGAAQESSMVQMRRALDGIPVARAMITDFRTLRADDTLARVVEYAAAGLQQDFPVLDGDRLVGILTRSDVLTELGRAGPEVRVADVMRRDYVTADPAEMLQPALARLHGRGCRTLPVVRDGRLVGLVTADHLSEVLLTRQALAESRPSTVAEDGHVHDGVSSRMDHQPKTDALGRDGDGWAR